MTPDNQSPAPAGQKHDTLGKYKILFLPGPASSVQNQLFDLLKPYAELVRAETIDHAASLLKTQSFDAVLTASSDFLPLEKNAVSNQALSILNTVGEGVCVVDRQGDIQWANFKMREFSDSIKQQICQHCRTAFDFFENKIHDLACPIDIRTIPPRRYCLTNEEENRYFEMTVNPMLDQKSRLVRVATVVWEQTSSRRLQQRIDAIDKAGRELVHIEAEMISSMTVEQRIKLLEDKIVRYARQLLHFDHFVVRLLNQQDNKLEVILGVGLPNQAQQMELFANIQNNGITGYVAATGRSYICNDLSCDPRYLPGLENARSCLTVPLLLHDKVIGTLNVESHKVNIFTEDDRQMAEIFGRYIAIAMNILNLLVFERYQTTGQATDNLSQQLTEPLNGILTKASMLREDYIGHDDIRHRLQDIIDRVFEIKTAIKDAQEQPKGILGAAVAISSAPTRDPQLQSRHILVVDDEEFIRQTIVDIVQQYGCIVDMACDGREAKALIAQHHYDLIISDIKLPHASGYEIFSFARSVDSSIPVILMTGFGYDPNHSIVRANREGLNAVLYKPFKVEQLLTEIRKSFPARHDDPPK